ncbi:MAG: hypothetical protein ACJ75E_14515 [Actinomycetes bacterium]
MQSQTDQPSRRWGVEAPGVGAGRQPAPQWAAFADYLAGARRSGVAPLRDGRASAAARRAVAVARAQLGSPYVWGAEGPAPFDCSGLTSFASARSIPLVPGDLVSSPTTPAAPAPSTTSACTSARA